MLRLNSQIVSIVFFKPEGLLVQRIEPHSKVVTRPSPAGKAISFVNIHGHEIVGDEFLIDACGLSDSLLIKRRQPFGSCIGIPVSLMQNT